MALKNIIGRARPRHNEINGRGVDMSCGRDVNRDRSQDVNKSRGRDRLLVIRLVTANLSE